MSTMVLQPGVEYLQEMTLTPALDNYDNTMTVFYNWWLTRNLRASVLPGDRYIRCRSLISDLVTHNLRCKLSNNRNENS
jgi:hypothetical protein